MDFDKIHSRFFIQLTRCYHRTPKNDSVSAYPRCLERYFRLITTNLTKRGEQLYGYRCPDCIFSLDDYTFVGAVYSTIYHFLEFPLHAISDDLARLFREERTAFVSVLGVKFNPTFKLPFRSTLKFLPKQRRPKVELDYRCVLEIPNQVLKRARVEYKEMLRLENEESGTEHQTPAESPGPTEPNNSNVDDTEENPNNSTFGGFEWNDTGQTGAFRFEDNTEDFSGVDEMHAETSGSASDTETAGPSVAAAPSDFTLVDERRIVYVATMWRCSLCHQNISAVSTEHVDEESASAAAAQLYTRTTQTLHNTVMPPGIALLRHIFEQHRHKAWNFSNCQQLLELKDVFPYVDGLRALETGRYACSLCDTSATLFSNAKKHARMMHYICNPNSPGGDPSEAEKSKQIPCEICGLSILKSKRYDEQVTVFAHKLKSHPGNGRLLGDYTKTQRTELAEKYPFIDVKRSVERSRELKTFCLQCSKCEVTCGYIHVLARHATRDHGHGRKNKITKFPTD